MACTKCKQAAQLLEAFKKTVGRVASGEQAVSLTLAAERLAICRKCEHFVPETTRCMVCTCKLSIKTPLVASRCDLDKW